LRTGLLVQVIVVDQRLVGFQVVRIVPRIDDGRLIGRGASDVIDLILPLPFILSPGTYELVVLHPSC
jgi:hypothetical protein